MTSQIIAMWRGSSGILRISTDWSPRRIGDGLRLILDFVPNHTSNEHPSFIESRSSRANPKRDWYIWRDAGAEGALPNNWLSRFGGSAWEWDGRTNQYYYHSFLKEQPDVNWRNPR